MSEVEAKLRISEGAGKSQDLGTRIREIRDRRFITQAELASQARVTVRTIQNVEKGNRPRPSTARKLAGALEELTGEEVFV